MAWRKQPDPIGYRVRRPMTLWGRKREIDDFIPAAEVVSLTRREALVRAGRLNPVYATDKKGNYETLRGSLRKKRDEDWHAAHNPAAPGHPEHPDHPEHPEHPNKPEPQEEYEPLDESFGDGEQPGKVQYPADQPYPTMSWPKADMLGWMTNNFPEISREGTKEELLDRLAQNVERV